ncbi:hypothetical protein DFJ74DRAFT_652486 [Hyaloraphidium curvatum]|nr:hypothetical protein DFJ74DRAFT_652486 [Hyaloraphidium curvatum]
MPTVTGTVRKLVGNQMPSPFGRPGGAASPLSVPVHVFKGDAISPHDSPGSKHAADLLKTVRSGKDGKYGVELPAGTYTIVAEIDGKLYLNMTTGKGHWHPVEVAEGKETVWNIDDTSEALF